MEPCRASKCADLSDGAGELLASFKAFFISPSWVVAGEDDG